MQGYGNGISHRVSAVLRILAVCGFLCVSTCAPSEPPPALPGQQRIFATPEQAVDALVSATRKNQKAELIKILGRRSYKLVHSGDAVADAQSRARFLAAYDQAHEMKSEDDNRYILVVGDEEWPLPIPLVYSKGGWWFDTAAGGEEILNRRIGRNELSAIGICRAYVEAQQEFAAMHPIKGNKYEYAQKFRSSPGMHDGLYWPVAKGRTESPFGLLIANATAEGYSDEAMGRHTPYHGYYFKILKAQGPHASGGAKSYIAGGHMTGGFALIAFPARYGDSGVMSFIISQNGIVYEKNLGPATAKIAGQTAQFDPDISWNIVR